MISFGDKRLDRRFFHFQGAMVRQCSVIVRRLAFDRNEEIGFGRFLRHPRVETTKILKSAYPKTSQASIGRHVLLVQDTSTMGFGLRPIAKLLGPVGDRSNTGFFLHPVLALDAEQGNCLGLAAAHFYQRSRFEEDDPLKDPTLRHLEIARTPFEEKESYRWWSSVEQAAEVTHQAIRQTMIADSESDIYDLMAHLLEAKLDFVLRNYQNRTLQNPGSKYNLFEHLAKLAVQATYQVTLPATDKRSAHVATLQIKWDTVRIKRPKNGKNKHLPDYLDLRVVEVKETPESVVNTEQPIHWRLITSHLVDNLAQALQIVQWYIWRWTIEQLFRTLKRKGLNIQSAQVESAHALHNLTALSLISAVQIMQLVQARHGTNQLPMELVFSPQEKTMIQVLNPKLEGKTSKLKNPHDPESLAFAAWVIARLGGWSGYNSQRPPGPITMYHGLQRLRDAAFLAYSDP